MILYQSSTPMDTMLGAGGFLKNQECSLHCRGAHNMKWGKLGWMCNHSSFKYHQVVKLYKNKPKQVEGRGERGQDTDKWLKEKFFWSQAHLRLISLFLLLSHLERGDYFKGSCSLMGNSFFNCSFLPWIPISFVLTK